MRSTGKLYKEQGKPRRENWAKGIKAFRDFVCIRQMNNYYNQSACLDETEVEALRKRLIKELEGAYFSGIGPAAAEIAAAEGADKEELLRLAMHWGVK